MKYLVTLLMLTAVWSTNAQTKINGIVMPNVVKANGKYLKINGGGIREKMFLDLYVGVLYLEEKSSDANSIIDADKPTPNPQNKIFFSFLNLVMFCFSNNGIEVETRLP